MNRPVDPALVKRYEAGMASYEALEELTERGLRGDADDTEFVVWALECLSEWMGIANAALEQLYEVGVARNRAIAKTQTTKARLTDGKAEMVLKRLAEKRTPAEIADELKCTERWVWVLKARGLKQREKLHERTRVTPVDPGIAHPRTSNAHGEADAQQPTTRRPHRRTDDGKPARPAAIHRGG